MIEASAACQDDPIPPGDTLLADYPVAGSGYDEMCSAPGLLRPHWRDLANALE